MLGQTISHHSVSGNLCAGNISRRYLVEDALPGHCVVIKTLNAAPDVQHYWAIFLRAATLFLRSTI